MFQKTAFPKRYFVLDFEKAILYIKKGTGDADDHSDTRTIHLANINAVSLPDQAEAQELTADSSLRPFGNPFYLETSDRRFVIYTVAENEQSMWLAAFDYLLQAKNRSGSVQPIVA